MTTAHLVEANGLIKRFGAIKAVDGVSFTVNRGDIYGFLGPNGSGKSTTIRMMLGLIKPDKGEVKLFGQPMNRKNYKLLAKVGALIERPDFYTYLSASKNLELLSSYSGLPKDSSRISEILDLVGLSDRADSKVRTFSQGMKQRLGIAQTLLHDPELIILDEPVNGLDPQGIKDVRNLLYKLNQEMGKTLIISSHILREMELVANRMLVISHGKVMIEGDVKSLLKSSSVKVILATNDTSKAVDLIKKTYPDIQLEINKLNEIIFQTTTEEVPKINQQLVESGIKVYQLSALNSLEDYFLSITA
ncbi:MAG: ABC transporter ATP-binding protein [Bacteroidetes bacterium]|nr:ABC transporter ATP-binding protein [Bacteroidota bacterium]MBU1578471.1 ABC transporter ATP-binding protein [Bacteroidota bacterium]MBU2466924.1 ABC transporter ATP-binding protein [Bacteroidota bacterium]MBU2557724.1 ABC transporter ATP-binding protein [Bacteroidota bacterium]